METRKENTMETKTKKKVIPVPHKCVFCNAVPRPIFIPTSEFGGSTLRGLECDCIGIENHVVKKRKWIYTVDVINNDVDSADITLINEWNRRMPEVMRRG